MWPAIRNFCHGVRRIRIGHPQGDAQMMEADLVISFKVFRERFGSRVVLWPEDHKIGYRISGWGRSNI